MKKPSSGGAFVRLWFVLFFSYACLRFAFNLAFMDLIDLRSVALWDVLVLPLGQSVVLWLITRRSRVNRDAPAADAPVPHGGSS